MAVSLYSSSLLFTGIVEEKAETRVRDLSLNPQYSLYSISTFFYPAKTLFFTGDSETSLSSDIWSERKFHVVKRLLMIVSDCLIIIGMAQR